MPAAAAAQARRDAPGTLQPVLELALDPPTAAARVARHPAVAAGRGAGSRSRSAPEEVIWLDTPDGDLAAKGLALEAPRRGARRWLRTLPEAGAPWIPGSPPAEAPVPKPPGEPTGLVPLAALSGRRTTMPLAAAGAGDAAVVPGPLSLELLQGKLRSVAAERPVARLRLCGPPGQALALARALAADLPVLPPAAALAEEGRALARGEAMPRPRRRGPPDLGGAATVEAALEAAIGHLLEVMLHQAPLCRAEAGPEGVHQMRVALRRLRSVLKAFRPAARCAELDAFDAGLKALARLLGRARDLDVFLLDGGGIGARVAAALPEDRRVATLLRAIEARRVAAYRSLREALEGPGFRLLALDGLALVALRPWRAADGPERTEALAEPLPEFATRLLDKRWHRLCSDGEDIRALSAEDLHALRLTAKRLRYAAELFAPLWPGKTARRFLKRLAALQEELGLANDAAVARGTVASLGSAAPAWAIGAVEGFAAARTGGARKRALSAWEDLMGAKPFWSTA